MTFSSLILGRVYAQLPDQIKARQAAKTAFKIIDRKSKIDSMSQLGLKPEKFLGNIEFKNVCFEYSSRPDIKILNNFNLSVQNGKTTALVGPSGCGKVNEQFIKIFYLRNLNFISLFTEKRVPR